VVLGCHAHRIQRHIPKSVRVVVNRQWRKGQLSSLQAALKKIPSRAAFLIYPVDHPLIRPGTIRQLVRSFSTRRPFQEIVMPRHKTAYGHPVIISAAVRPEFFAATTAREVIYSVPKRIRVVEVKTTAILEDFNSPETYDQVRQKFQHNVRRL
jgi:CTP:molybdopterin cytidylyltransferase MocA